MVVGAGAVGLSAAIRLVRDGLRVTVVEKSDLPGGRCARVVRDGHLFDVGPTLFVLPRLYEQEFTALGASMHDLCSTCGASTPPTTSSSTTASSLS
ncbi:MAG: FAD-dependent oxidoreductase [Chloroflexota bacterium]